MTPEVSMQAESGGSLVTLERIRELEKNCKLTVFTLKLDNSAREHFANVEWHVAGARLPRNAITLLQSYLARLPLSVWRNTTRDALRAAASLNDGTWDMIYVDHWLMIEIAHRVESANRILHLHNAEPEVFYRAAQLASFPSNLLMWSEGYRSAVYLRRNVARFNGLHLLSKDDIDALRARDISHPNTQVFLPAASQPKSL